MKISNIVKNVALYESLDNKNRKSLLLWESVGQKIVEAQLTSDQISQLFQQIEQDQTASGSNRTFVGKGKDAAEAVSNAYKDLKAKVADSKPMQNADALYDQAAEKLKQATGGDQGVMQYVQKYRDFAKAHPLAQSLIYGTLIAAAGITGAGAGGAAALGLFKMVDKLLQGEKFSTASIAGAETGLAAFAASKLGDLIKGVNPGEQVPAPTDGRPLSTSGYDFTNKDYYLSPTGTQTVAVPKGYGNPWEEGTKAYNIRQQLKSGVQESVVYAPAQITALFETIVVEAGLWNQFKGAVGQAADTVSTKAQQVGKNITTKVTADKLEKAWKAAGSPTDSEEISAILQKQGVSQDVIDNTMTSFTPASTQQPATSGTVFDDPQKLADEFEAHMTSGGSIPPQLRGVLKDILTTALGTVAEGRRR